MKLRYFLILVALMAWWAGDGRTQTPKPGGGGTSSSGGITGNSCPTNKVAVSIGNTGTLTCVTITSAYVDSSLFGTGSIIPEANGGTGANNTVGVAGHVLRSNATHYVDSALACADLSNASASCSTDTTNAANIGSGTLPAGRLPAPTASTLGGIESITSLSNNWVYYIDTSGVPHQSQPASTDLSDATTLINTSTNCGGNLSGVFPNCSTAAIAPAIPPNQTLTGLGVEYVSGLSYTVGTGTYAISGVTYTISSLVPITLTAADMTNDRIDLIIVDNTSTVSFVTGTPAVNPQAPTIDPSTQLQLTFVYVPANATAPSNVTANQIFLNGSEWTQTYSAHIALTTNSPYGSSTHSMEATTAVLNNNVVLLDPSSGTVDLGTKNSLIFYIKSKGTWPSGASGSTAARFLSIYFKNGSTQKGTVVVLRDGVLGFNSSNTTTYQQITIPATSFGINGIPVTSLEYLVSGNSGSSTIGFYIGNVTLQAGSTNTPLPTTLTNYKGAWSAATAYNFGDIVTSNGYGYIAKVANTNVGVTITATWDALATIVVHPIAASFDGGSASPTAGKIVYITVPYSCKIQGWNIVAVPAGNVSVAVWKITVGAAVPTVSNLISASAPITISGGTATANQSTAINTWTGYTSTGIPVSFNDIFAFNLVSATTSTFINVVLNCQ